MVDDEPFTTVQPLTTDQKDLTISATESTSAGDLLRVRNDSVLLPSAPTSDDSTNDRINDRLTESPTTSSQGSSSLLTMQPRFSAIVDVIQQFIQEERLRSFCFLGKYSHVYTDQQDMLVVGKADADKMEILRAREFSNGSLSWIPDHEFFAFYEPMDGNNRGRIVCITVTPGQEITIGSLTITAPIPNGKKPMQYVGVRQTLTSCTLQTGWKPTQLPIGFARRTPGMTMHA
jgi:hypothetical protein